MNEMVNVKEYLISLGYSNESIEKILGNNSLTNFKEDTLLIHIKNNYNFFITFGYNHKDILKMTKLLPTLYGYSIENIKQKMDDLISLGYSREDVIKMTKLLPALYSYSIENIKQKIEFYKEINLEFIMVCDTKNLMQSIDLTYARYVFFKDKGIEINENNYKKLFFDAKRFKKQYGIDKSTLLEKYNYQEYINSKKGANII